ncbi:hypothetical protein QAD02_008265 [Eretmocerus hayati]|uniref:Uncharacterized protein n=1 Tax=Eretmocerus hayati TaxID=131215 RepID=A0ACC2N7A9_9HYME|nr:hypothetical protein QAD02_008265 [Eretmocerus hayati]
MAFLHTQSCECLKSELLSFEIPPTQTTIEGSRYIQYKPISSLTDDSPIEFIVSGNASNDPASSTLRVINISQENSLRMSDDSSGNKEPPGISDASQKDSPQDSSVLSENKRSSWRPSERALRKKKPA